MFAFSFWKMLDHWNCDCVECQSQRYLHGREYTNFAMILHDFGTSFIPPRIYIRCFFITYRNKLAFSGNDTFGVLMRDYLNLDKWERRKDTWKSGLSDINSYEGWMSAYSIENKQRFYKKRAPLCIHVYVGILLHMLALRMDTVLPRMKQYGHHENLLERRARLHDVLHGQCQDGSQPWSRLYSNLAATASMSLPFSCSMCSVLGERSLWSSPEHSSHSEHV